MKRKINVEEDENEGDDEDNTKILRKKGLIESFCKFGIYNLSMFGFVLTCGSSAFFSHERKKNREVRKKERKKMREKGRDVHLLFQSVFRADVFFLSFFLFFSLFSQCSSLFDHNSRREKGTFEENV